MVEVVENIVGPIDAVDIEKEEMSVKKTTKKKVIRRKKKVAKKATRKKIVRRKKKVRMVAKRGPGRPPTKRGPGRPAKKRRGRQPMKKVGRRAGARNDVINLPITAQTDTKFWTDLLLFVNMNRRKAFIIQLDGLKFSLGTI
jgi:hypothetical protein